VRGGSAPAFNRRNAGRHGGHGKRLSTASLKGLVVFFYPGGDVRIEKLKWEVKMPYISFYFDAYCAECGNGMCKQVEVSEENGHVKLYISPCPYCLKEAYRQGYENGRNEIVQAKA
jgi:hypothetical protein